MKIIPAIFLFLLITSYVFTPGVTLAEISHKKSKALRTKEYIVTTSKSVDESKIKEVFKDFSVVEVLSLQSSKQFLVKFRKDPGLRKLQKLSNEKEVGFVIQPNFPVHILGKKENGIQ